MAIVFFAFATSIYEKKRVLILHSYHPGYSWVSDINLAWSRRYKVQNNVQLRTYYMDTKRFPHSYHKQKAGRSAIDLINRWKPDILVAFDDDAQKYVATNFVNHKEMSIVYGGVNNELSKYNYLDANNVYGIKERLQLNAFKAALNDLKTKGKNINSFRIAHLSDQSTFSKNLTKQVKNFDWSPHILVSSTECTSFDEWKIAAQKANQEADLMFITNYHTLDRYSKDTTRLERASEKIAVPGEEVISWTTNSTSIPLLGAYGFLVDDGGTLSLGISPYEQGDVAAEFTLRLLEGKSIPESARHVVGDNYLVFMSQKRMSDWGWDLSDLYVSFAQATGNFLVE